MKRITLVKLRVFATAALVKIAVMVVANFAFFKGANNIQVYVL